MSSCTGGGDEGGGSRREGCLAAQEEEVREGGRDGERGGRERIRGV